jgi:hypothetical protein
VSVTAYLLAALFLPLFPISLAFNTLFARLRQPLLRALLLLAWPQIGVYILLQTPGGIPDAVVVWALLSAAFYAYRALALREVGLWIGFLATSAWALIWSMGATPELLWLEALGFSLPLALLSLLTGALEQRVGAAHTALGGGLAAAAPRLAALFVVAVLAVEATPVFPGFFTLLAGVLGHAATAPGTALALLLVWLLWTWSGTRLLHGIVVGPRPHVPVEDVSRPVAWGYATAFVALAGVGIEFGGLLL